MEVVKVNFLNPMLSLLHLGNTVLGRKIWEKIRYWEVSRTPDVCTIGTVVLPPASFTITSHQTSKVDSRNSRL